MTACSWSKTRPLTLTVAPMAQERTSDRQVEPTQRTPWTDTENPERIAGSPSARTAHHEEAKCTKRHEGHIGPCFVTVVFLRAFVTIRCEDVSSDRRTEKA